MGTYLYEAFDKLRIEIENTTASNDLFVRYGTVIRTLDRFREEQNIDIPNPLEIDLDKYAALIHQIRNLFAHDTIEPVWNIGKERYRRLYEFDDVLISLVDRHNKPFCFSHVNGAESIFSLRSSLESRL